MPHTTVSEQCVQLPQLLKEVTNLKHRILTETEKEIAKLDLTNTSEAALYSILNVLNYVIMRREKLHSLQSNLAQAGLSSLGRIEPHVMTNIDSVLEILSRVVSCESYPVSENQVCIDYEGGYRQLKKRAERLFGSPPKGRSEYIMVTIPTEAASQPELIESFLKAGMNNARINCAHDDAETWLAMIEHIRSKSTQLGCDCRILMDLAGHKIRTGDIIASKHKQEKHKSKDTQKPPRVLMGDWIILSKSLPDSSEPFNQFAIAGDVLVTCTYADVIDLVNCEETVWFDDGKIGTIIKQKNDQALLLQVTHVGPKGARLKTQKGINFPQTALNLPSLSHKDCSDLEFVSQHADMVGLSFAECAEDVLYLQNKLIELGRIDLPILAKIETADAVQNLPDILIKSLAENIDIGVMIARGDLAVELGSVRMAETQDEILRLCESAHVPVIWATQVLESLAKQGTISRPEISDAAMSQRAECVMLNKGPYITDAVNILSEVLQKMEAHQFKSHTHFRALKW
ncbi:pyruvate kinase [Thiomicrorhabdus sp. Milos-T2]|uniref:pyruvate kinase n=1 Tax=Thiomicrorhabdus sp. Milos-T2 TaxID=90814 RepID=UPI00068A5540|nr:pyruvate kinase [Thiomicrorhabdus sp. Milos-T2]